MDPILDIQLMDEPTYSVEKNSEFKYLNSIKYLSHDLSNFRLILEEVTCSKHLAGLISTTLRQSHSLENKSKNCLITT
jgi:hypothetical protein